MENELVMLATRLNSAGYRRGTAAERLLRDARALDVVAGTSEAQRMIIAAQVAADTR